MKEKRVVLICAVYFVILLLLPVYSVFCHFDTLRTGEYYKIRVSPADPYDPFRGRYAAIRADISLYDHDNYYEYITLEKDAGGYAVNAVFHKEPPEGSVYAKKMEITRYYMNEKMAPKADEIQRTAVTEGDDVYAYVAVKSGRYVIQGLYVNDVPIEIILGGGGK